MDMLSCIITSFSLFSVSQLKHSEINSFLILTETPFDRGCAEFSNCADPDQYEHHLPHAHQIMFQATVPSAHLTYLAVLGFGRGGRP